MIIILTVFAVFGWVGFVACYFAAADYKARYVETVVQLLGTKYDRDRLYQMHKDATGGGAW